MIRIILLLIFATKLMSKDIQEFALSIIAHPPLISLKQALNEAKKQNYDLQKEYKQLQIASSARDKSFAPLIPRLDFFLAKEAKLFQNNENDNDKAVFKLETKLFDMKSLFAVKSSSDELRAAKYNYEQASNKIFFEVANAYSETLIAQSLAVLAQEELEQYQKQLEVYQKKLQAGLARPLDISRGEYLFNKSKTNLILKKRDFERKRAQLGALISRKELFQVEDFLLESPYFDESLEILQSLAQNTAESNSLKLKYSAQNYSILSEGFNYFPILKTTIEGGLHTPPHDNSSPSHEAFSKIMFTIELPIFNQGLPHAELKKKIAQRDLIELSQRELQLTKHLGINGVLEQIQASQVALTSADLALKAAKKAKKSAERLYKAQEATALELVEANVNFSSAQSLFLNAQLHLKQSKLQLLYLIGKMSEIE